MNDIDRMLNEARDAADAAVADVVVPPFHPPEPTFARRAAVAVRAAAMLIVIIGGSTWWVRQQDTTTDTATATTVAATKQATTPPPPTQTGAQDIDALTERLRTVGADLRTITGPSRSIEAVGLSARHDYITSLATAVDAEEALDVLEALTAELAAIRRIEAEVVARQAAAQTAHRRASELLDAYDGEPTVELAAELRSLLEEAEQHITTLRSSRDDLAARTEQLERAMAAVFVTVAPPEPGDELTVTHHDYGLRDRDFGGTTIEGVTSSERDVWAITGLVMSPECGDCGELLHVDGGSGELITSIQLPQPMRHIVNGDDLIWLARTGDGALPDSLVGTLDPASHQVTLTDIGEVNVSAIAPDGDDGLWIASSYPPSVSYFDRAAGEIVRTLDLNGDEPLVDLVLALEPNEVLWVASWDGRVLHVDPEAGTVLATFEVAHGIVDLALTTAVTATGSSVWAVGSDGATFIGNDAGPIDTQPLDGEVCCALAASAAGESIWVATRSGELWYIYPGGLDLVATVDLPSDDPSEGGGPQAITLTASSMWLTQGPWLTEVRLPQ